MDAQDPAALGGRITTWLISALILVITAAGSPALAFQTFNRIKTGGELRIGQLAPASVTADQERVLAMNLAARLGARPYFIDFVGVDELLKGLADGDVDVAIEPLSQARPLPAGLASTLPVRHADLWRVTSPYVAESRSTNATLTVHFASDAWHQALALKKGNEHIQLSVAPVRASRHALLTQVGRGEVTASLAYEHEFTDRAITGLRPRQRLRDQVALSWVLRAADRVLEKKVNDFLREQTLTRSALYVDRGDWEAIQKRGRIRLVTLYRPETYFAWSGQFMGFEYDLARAFVRHHDLGLEVVIARSRQEMLERLTRGEADIAAGLLAPETLPAGLAGSEPYFTTSGRVVSRRGRFHRLGPLDFHQKDVLLSPGTPYPQHFERLAGVGISAKVVELPLSPSELLDAVARGEADFAVIDDHEFQLQSLWRDDLVSLSKVELATPRSWIMRSDTPELAAAVDKFLVSDAGRRRVRIGRSKYFAGSKAADSFKDAVAVFQRDHGYSPFDELARRYASYYAFDWRLILAVMLQESRFDPNAVSRSGARGLMQVQDAASRQVGISNLFDPKDAVHAGVKYLDWVRSQFEADLDIRDRTWFSLAAYNGGLTHVNAARKLAASQGRDPRRWFGHVELAMGDLSSQPRYQALDSRQVTDYVTRVRDYYEMYVRLTEHQRLPGSGGQASPAVAAYVGE
ncbi:MAG: transglycosylase SLT domain-containing protein [Pseudomonadota bacterium]